MRRVMTSCLQKTNSAQTWEFHIYPYVCIHMCLCVTARIRTCGLAGTCYTHTLHILHAHVTHPTRTRHTSYTHTLHILYAHVTHPTRTRYTWGPCHLANYSTVQTKNTTRRYKNQGRVQVIQCGRVIVCKGRRSAPSSRHILRRTPVIVTVGVCEDVVMLNWFVVIFYCFIKKNYW